MTDKSYTAWRSMSDGNLMRAIGTFIRHHRIQQNKTQERVAFDAGISRSTLSLLERGETVTVASMLQVLRVLDLLQVMDVFKVQQQFSPIELARLEQRQRKRARSSDPQQTGSDW